MKKYYCYISSIMVRWGTNERALKFCVDWYATGDTIYEIRKAKVMLQNKNSSSLLLKIAITCSQENGNISPPMHRTMVSLASSYSGENALSRNKHQRLIRGLFTEIERFQVILNKF